jgi:hypothetical protein
MIYHEGLTRRGTPDSGTAADDPETTRRNARASGTPLPTTTRVASPDYEFIRR